MSSEGAYQIIKITDDKSTRLPWIMQGEKYFVDLKEMKSLIDNHPSADLRSYFNKLTLNGEKSFLLEKGLPDSEGTYYRQSWTKKDNLIRIISFKSLGLESDINAILGPLASIPTVNYGVATYAINFEGEILTIKGPAIKSIWSFKKLYWSNAKIYFPADKSSSVKIALIQIGLPINLMDDYNYHGIHAIIPR